MPSTSAPVAIVLVCLIVCLGGTPSSSGNTARDRFRDGPAAVLSGGCRTFLTAATNVTVAGNLTATVTFACGFDAPASRYTCRLNYSDNNRVRYDGVQTTSYKSKSDAVDEVRVVPPLTRWLSLSQTIASVRSDLTHSFDAESRPIRLVSVTASGTITTTYRAWDTLGRPTAGTEVAPQLTTALSFAYDDTARTSTTTRIAPGYPRFVGVQAYNSDGLQTVYNTTFGDRTSTTTTTIASTERVCR
jgi:hypothetical protein